ncbi:MAG: phosphotransferase family protein [Humibacter sp.]
MTEALPTGITEASLARLGAFLAERGLVEADAPLSASRVGDGHSNLTYLVTAGDRRVVVRRPPLPPFPRGAHDVLREASFLAALAGSGVPVPDVLATGTAGEVFDVDFFVMSHLSGRVFTTEPPQAGLRRRLGLALADTLARLHEVDWRAQGLRGHPEGSNARQVAKLGRLVADENGDPPPEFAAIDAWLARNAPVESGSAVVHSDFRLGNVLVDGGSITGVLDWELASIGDPLIDLGYLVAAWAEPGREPATPIERLGAATSADGFPTRAELVERYATASGRDVTSLAWYLALAEWKLAVLYEYNRRRAVAGHGDPYYSDASFVAEFLAAAHLAAGL